jgi:hypothetical protein
MKLELYILVLFSFIFNCKTNTPLRPSVSVNAYDVVTSPLEVQVNSMGVWHASEGELGRIEVIDHQGKLLCMGFLTTTEDWMKEGPVLFKTLLEFDPKHAEEGTLIICNNPGDGSGEEARESQQFEVPIRFKP